MNATLRGATPTAITITITITAGIEIASTTGIGIANGIVSTTGIGGGEVVFWSWRIDGIGVST